MDKQRLRGIVVRLLLFIGFAIFVTNLRSGKAMDNFVCVLFGILIGIVIGMKVRRRPEAVSPFTECPYCQEPIRTGAKVCKSCHRSVEKELASR
jgi:hypothetical protein